MISGAVDLSCSGTKKVLHAKSLQGVSVVLHHKDMIIEGDDTEHLAQTVQDNIRCYPPAQDAEQDVSDDLDKSYVYALQTPGYYLCFLWQTFRMACSPWSLVL